MNSEHKKGIRDLAIMMEFIIRDGMEDIHASGELDQEDMKNMNISLRNHFFTYLTTTNKFDIHDVHGMLKKVMLPFRDKVKNKRNFDKALLSAVHELRTILKDSLKDPSILSILYARVKGFKHEEPEFII